jgi:hypothetical protein
MDSDFTPLKFTVEHVCKSEYTVVDYVSRMFEDMPLKRVESPDDKYSGDLHRRLQSCIKYLPLSKAC